MDTQEELSPTSAEPIAAVSVAPSRHPFQFTGTASEYFRIWIVNLALTIVTLGIYSAWAKVRTHRYFFAHTRVADAHFEYTGNPMAILRGRVIMVVVLLVKPAGLFGKES